MTIPAFDILKKDGLYGPAWIEAVADLEQAKIRAQQLAASAPGEYIVFSQQTQQVVISVKAKSQAA